ncbi:hypothetical protein ACFX1Q_010586 [Malus domestica]
MGFCGFGLWLGVRRDTARKEGTAKPRVGFRVLVPVGSHLGLVSEFCVAEALIPWRPKKLMFFYPNSPKLSLTRIRIFLISVSGYLFLLLGRSRFSV